MRVSYPELYTHCKKVLEGCGLPIGLAEEGAEMVAWGEFTGMYGIVRLAQDLNALQVSDPTRISISSQDDRLVSVDGGGQHVLLTGRVAVDLAFAKAFEMGIGVVQVKNSQGSDALIQNVRQVGKRGMSCAIHWMEKNSQNWSFITEGNLQPCVIKEMLAQRVEVKQINSFLVICANGNYLPFFTDLTAWNNAKENIHMVQPEQLQVRFDESNGQGREVDADTWAELGQVASRVLVEATELSRQRGAGEGAN
ncbi:Ldh family oxidoreductase [Ammoniphilus sp. 3BR4]|uniref:Ldh family oxidoreductase n=1 Tax=Ammoniphilus sp. 3BR4 TaxID=3158265 RepID=UPI003466836A